LENAEYHHVENEAKHEPLESFRMIVGPNRSLGLKSYTLCDDDDDDDDDDEILVYIHI
jgi:hypothetical protein